MLLFKIVVICKKMLYNTYKKEFGFFWRLVLNHSTYTLEWERANPSLTDNVSEGGDMMTFLEVSALLILLFTAADFALRHIKK